VLRQKDFFSQGALIINKQRNRLNKDTFEKTLCLKSWGIIKEDKEIIEDIEEKEEDKEVDNIFII
jgi:hypothetical protein